MNRKLKILGHVLVAVMALSAVAASAASAANFTAASYPVSLHGEQPAEPKHVFYVGDGEVECETVTFTGTSTSASETQTITPYYGGTGACEAFGFVGATVQVNGCDYLFNVTGTVNLVCPTGREIKISDNLGICTVHVKPQTGINGISYANNGNHLDVTAASTNIHAVITGAFCPATVKTHTNAAYSGKVTLKGNGGVVKIDKG